MHTHHLITTTRTYKLFQMMMWQQVLTVCHYYSHLINYINNFFYHYYYGFFSSSPVVVVVIQQADLTECLQQFNHPSIISCTSIHIKRRREEKKNDKGSVRTYFILKPIFVDVYELINVYIKHFSLHCFRVYVGRRHKYVYLVFIIKYTYYTPVAPLP